jgi:sigma-54 dependent transcriptional regulator, acetoin dehydrogenase operon transcriptional activator AcoR
VSALPSIFNDGDFDMAPSSKATGPSFGGRLAHVHRAWEQFIDGKPVRASQQTPKVILDSWKRCRDYGIDPFMGRVSEILKGEKLKSVLKKNRLLIEISSPFMEILHSYVKGSGFSVVLFDTNGHIVHIIGDEDLMQNHQKKGFVRGSSWTEQSMGTNGCGTALAEKRPIQICACEHFCRFAHPYSCSAAPIHSPDGQILGIINMTGLYENVHPHTLGAVVSAAQAIENEFHRQKAVENLKEAYHFQQAIFDSSQDALIAISKDKTIRLVNDRAKLLLKLPTDMGGQRIADVFPEKGNAPFIKDLLSDRSLLDKECTVYRGANSYKFTVSSTLINAAMEGSWGSIVALREIKRTRKLVTNTIGANAKFHCHDIIGEDPRFLDTIELCKRAGQSTSNVLLLGASGTGKDIFAQAIHNASNRKDGPYIAINCGAIPRELITSELFGYVEGAFTGSKRGGNPGKFELADGGTIFLDEIGEMPIELQIVLLRVIEERKITRIGAKVSTPCDVRIIAATNKNLRDEVYQKGNFREDLYFRLNVFTIETLPLRAKKGDIPLLVDATISRLNSRLNTQIKHVHRKVLDGLLNYDWPGNVRELQNVIERMMNLALGTELTPDLLPPEIAYNKKPVERNYDGLSLEEIERLRIMELLNNNITKDEIARQLKIARSTLYLKIKKYGLDGLNKIAYRE